MLVVVVALLSLCLGQVPVPRVAVRSQASRLQTELARLGARLPAAGPAGGSAVRTYRVGAFILKPTGALASTCGQRNTTERCSEPCSKARLLKLLRGPDGVVEWFGKATNGRIRMTMADKDVIELALPSLPSLPAVPSKSGPLPTSGLVYNHVKKLLGRDPLLDYDRVFFLFPEAFRGYPSQPLFIGNAYITKTAAAPYGFDIHLAGCPARSLVHEMVHTFGCGHTMSLFEGFFPNGTAQTRNEQYGDISSILGNESIQPERQSTKRGLTAPCLERMKVLDQSTLLTVSQQSSSFRLNSLMSFKAPCAATFRSCNQTFFIEWKERKGVDADLTTSLVVPKLWSPGPPAVPNDISELGHAVPSGSLTGTLLVRRNSPPDGEFGLFTKMEHIVAVGQTQVSPKYGFTVSHPALGSVKLQLGGPCGGPPRVTAPLAHVASLAAVRPRTK